MVRVGTYRGNMKYKNYNFLTSVMCYDRLIGNFDSLIGQDV